MPENLRVTIDIHPPLAYQGMPEFPAALSDSGVSEEWDQATCDEFVKAVESPLAITVLRDQLGCRDCLLAHTRAATGEGLGDLEQFMIEAVSNPGYPAYVVGECDFLLAPFLELEESSATETRERIDLILMQALCTFGGGKVTVNFEKK